MNKLHYGIALILFIMLFSTIPILHQNQTKVNNETESLNEMMEPLIINVSTNIWNGFGLASPYFQVTSFVEYANSCIMSYAYVKLSSCADFVSGDAFANESVNWINVTMVKSGNTYDGIINTDDAVAELSWGLLEFHWKIFANDVYGHSVVWFGDRFETWSDP